MAIATLVISAPTVWEAFKLAPVAAAASGAQRTAIADLGNLSAAMPLRAVGGVWVSGDIRYPENGDILPTTLGLALVALLAVLGLVRAARHRDWGVLGLSVASLVAFVYFARQTGPWIQLKAITMTSPVVLTLAFVGAAGLLGHRRRPRLGALAGWTLGGVVALAVLAGNALAYHYFTFAPTERLRDLERIGERFAGVEGPTLYTAHDEYAEYFLREMNVTGLVNPPGEGLGFPQIRSEVTVDESGYPFRADLDMFERDWIKEFAMIVMPRDPTVSRPPANYDLVARTEQHDVWRRVRPASSVLVHVPLLAEGSEDVAEEKCAELVQTAEEEGEGARLAYVQRAASARVELGTAEAPSYWERDGESLVIYGAGRARSDFRLRGDGEYRIWLKGPYQRELRISLDGRALATAEDRWSYPERWTLLDTGRLRAGGHSLLVERSAADLEPGDGAAGQPVGPFVLERITPGRDDVVRYAPASEAATLCGDREGLDWISLVKAPPEV